MHVAMTLRQDGSDITDIFKAKTFALSVGAYSGVIDVNNVDLQRIIACRILTRAVRKWLRRVTDCINR